MDYHDSSTWAITKAANSQTLFIGSADLDNEARDSDAVHIAKLQSTLIHEATSS